jgi:hypothetical protein
MNRLAQVRGNACRADGQWPSQRSEIVNYSGLLAKRRATFASCRKTRYRSTSATPTTRPSGTKAVLFVAIAVLSPQRSSPPLFRSIATYTGRLKRSPDSNVLCAEKTKVMSNGSKKV